jgi:hypothetical protein
MFRHKGVNKEFKMLSSDVFINDLQLSDPPSGGVNIDKLRAVKKDVDSVAAASSILDGNIKGLRVALTAGLAGLDNRFSELSQDVTTRLVLDSSLPQTLAPVAATYNGPTNDDYNLLVESMNQQSATLAELIENAGRTNKELQKAKLEISNLRFELTRNSNAAKIDITTLQVDLAAVSSHKRMGPELEHSLQPPTARSRIESVPNMASSNHFAVAPTLPFSVAPTMGQNFGFTVPAYQGSPSMTQPALTNTYMPAYAPVTQPYNQGFSQPQPTVQPDPQTPIVALGPHPGQWQGEQSLTFQVQKAVKDNRVTSIFVNDLLDVVPGGDGYALLTFRSNRLAGNFTQKWNANTKPIQWKTLTAVSGVSLNR